MEPDSKIIIMELNTESNGWEWLERSLQYEYFYEAYEAIVSRLEENHKKIFWAGEWHQPFAQGDIYFLNDYNHAMECYPAAAYISWFLTEDASRIDDFSAFKVYVRRNYVNQNQ